MKAIMVAFFCFVLLVYATQESFAIMYPLSTEELAKDSELIIRGKVEEVEGKWGKDKDIIVTQVSIIVSEVLKGITPEEKTIIVEYDGGEVEGVGFGVSDSAQFKKGEDVLLFLKSVPSKVAGSVYAIIGAAQGKYVINEDGIAHKEGYAVVEKEGMIIDNDIPVDALINKISEKAGHAFIWIDRGDKDNGRDGKN